MNEIKENTKFRMPNNVEHKFGKTIHRNNKKILEEPVKIISIYSVKTKYFIGYVNLKAAIKAIKDNQWILI